MQALYLITDGGTLRRRGVLVEKITAALEGAGRGVSFIQLREQVGSSDSASDDEVLALGTSLLTLAHEYGAKLLINRRADLAAKLGADGAHVGQSLENIDQARALLGPDKAIGYSAHSVEEALAAAERSADYLFLSPIFSPLSKQDKRPALGLEVLKELTRQTETPVFALGGIAPENVAACRNAGADGIACISSALCADDPKDASEQLLNAWNA